MLLMNTVETNRYLGGNLLPWFKIEIGYINGKKCKMNR